MRVAVIFATLLIVCVCSSCTRKENSGRGQHTSQKNERRDVTLRHFPADDLTDLLQVTGVEVDMNSSTDGNGSLRVTSPEAAVIPLYEIDDLDVQNAVLLYEAGVRTDILPGQVALVMSCTLENGMEFFAGGATGPSYDDSVWTMLRASFFLEENENPATVRLALRLDAPGTVWIDAIRLKRITR